MNEKHCQMKNRLFIALFLIFQFLAWRDVVFCSWSVSIVRCPYKVAALKSC
jgi:hypothetical protein